MKSSAFDSAAKLAFSFSRNSFQEGIEHLDVRDLDAYPRGESAERVRESKGIEGIAGTPRSFILFCELESPTCASATDGLPAPPHSFEKSEDVG